MQEIIDTDVLVVGGGPAGLLAAESAAAAGIKTIVIEKEKQIGYPVHTSGATDLKTLNDFNIPPECYHLLKGVRVCSPQNSAVFKSEQPLGCVVDVTRLYRLLATRAQKQGTIIMTGTEATLPIADRGCIAGCEAIINTDQPVKFLCKVLVDASGYGASISKKAGLHTGFSRFGVGAEYELIAPNCDQDEIVIVVGSRYAPAGYAWAFPWGQERVRLGVGILHADSQANPKDHLQTFLQEAANLNINLKNSRIVESHFGLVPAEGMASRMAGHGIICVGDAAGQASLVAGEGIRLCMRAGYLAGRTAADAVLKKKYDKAMLSKYEKQFRARYSRNLNIGEFLNLRMSRWSDNVWDRRVEDIKAVPNDIILNLLQSEFSSWKFARWFITRPKFWPNLLGLGRRAIFHPH
jgi:digeranylgeranylglycerophospholipid reductase